MTDVSGVGSTTTSNTSTSSTTNSALTMSGAQFSALGIGSGIDLQSIVQALVQSYSQPQQALQTSVATHQALVKQYQTLNTNFSAIQTAAQKLNIGVDWQVKSATASDSSVTATATTLATNGSLSFQVNRLATAENAASFGSVSSLTSVVGSGNFLIGAAGSLGFRNIVGDSNLALGNHTIAVTQASNGATFKGSPVADSVTLNGTETLNATIDGTSHTFTLQAGTYNQQQLAAMVNKASGGLLNVSVNSDKSLQVTSAHEGSAASMSIDGGTGLAALGLTATGTANGTDGIVTVDGVANTVSSIQPDGSNQVVLNSTAGTITTSFSGGLRTGTSTVANVSTGDGTLSTLVANINAAGAGVNAAAVQVGTNQFKLQLQATTTGAAGELSMSNDAFTSTLGQVEVVSAAQDAQLQIGTGANAYTIDSSSNTVANVLPGLTVNVTSADPNKTITVNIQGDEQKLQGEVQDLVNAVNTATGYITTNSSYDAGSKTAGPLLGNFEAETLQSQLNSAMNAGYPGSTLGALASIGITQNNDGTYAFDTSVFQAAYAKDPNSVASLFVDGGTSGHATGNQGAATALANIAQNATDAVSGSITTMINGENTTIKDLDTQIDDWTTRIQQYQNLLLQQYSQADTMVANLKSQQTYLSGQVTSLQANQ